MRGGGGDAHNSTKRKHDAIEGAPPRGYPVYFIKDVPAPFPATTLDALYDVLQDNGLLGAGAESVANVALAAIAAAVSSGSSISIESAATPWPDDDDERVKVEAEGAHARVPGHIHTLRLRPAGVHFLRKRAPGAVRPPPPSFLTAAKEVLTNVAVWDATEAVSSGGQQSWMQGPLELHRSSVAHKSIKAISPEAMGIFSRDADTAGVIVLFEDGTVGRSRYTGDFMEYISDGLSAKLQLEFKAEEEAAARAGRDSTFPHSWDALMKSYHRDHPDQCNGPNVVAAKEFTPLLIRGAIGELAGQMGHRLKRFPGRFVVDQAAGRTTLEASALLGMHRGLLSGCYWEHGPELILEGNNSRGVAQVRDKVPHKGTLHVPVYELPHVTFQTPWGPVVELVWCPTDEHGVPLAAPLRVRAPPPAGSDPLAPNLRIMPLSVLSAVPFAWVAGSVKAKVQQAAGRANLLAGLGAMGLVGRSHSSAVQRGFGAQTVSQQTGASVKGVRSKGVGGGFVAAAAALDAANFSWVSEAAQQAEGRANLLAGLGAMGLVGRSHASAVQRGFGAQMVSQQTGISVNGVRSKGVGGASAAAALDAANFLWAIDFLSDFKAAEQAEGRANLLAGLGAMGLVGLNHTTAVQDGFGAQTVSKQTGKSVSNARTKGVGGAAAALDAANFLWVSAHIGAVRRNEGRANLLAGLGAMGLVSRSHTTAVQGGFGSKTVSKQTGSSVNNFRSKGVGGAPAAAALDAVNGSRSATASAPEPKKKDVDDDKD